jgi:hypothetical protein
MTLGKFPISFSTRLKQFLCKHETIGKTAFTQGINSKEGYEFVLYECGKCRHCITKWEKKEDW